LARIDLSQLGAPAQLMLGFRLPGGRRGEINFVHTVGVFIRNYENYQTVSRE